MKHGPTLFLLLFSTLTASTAALTEEPLTTTTTPYLLAGAPTFDPSTSQFCESLNTQNPKLILNGFRVIDSSRDRVNLTHTANKINKNLYASSVPEHGILKTKSIQITWLLIQGPEQEAAKTKTLKYMTAVVRIVVPLPTKKQSQKKLQKPPATGKDKHRYAGTEGVIRRVVVDNGEKGLTFTVELIKPALSEDLGGSSSP